MRKLFTILVFALSFAGYCQTKKDGQPETLKSNTKLDSTELANRFSKLYKEYEIKENSLKVKKNKIKNLLHNFSIIKNTNDSIIEIQKLLNEAKNEHAQLEIVYLEQLNLKKEYSNLKFSIEIFKNYPFTEHEKLYPLEGLFNEELHLFLKKNKYLSDSVLENYVKNNFHTKDIYNPINFTTFYERMP